MQTAEKILLEALTKSPLDDELNEMLLKLYFLRKDKSVIHYPLQKNQRTVSI